MKIPLSQIAHGRSGDKGDTSNIGIIAYNPRNIVGLFGWLRESLGRAYRRVRPITEATSDPAK